MTSCGAAIINLLAEQEVEHIFGIPGNHNLEIYRGLTTSHITHITTRHEQGAAFMADGYARAIGKPGVCLLISGPGLLNAATAIAQARADSVPMLVITSVAASTSLGQELGELHELTDQQAAANTFCRHSLTIMDPSELEPALDWTFRQFRESRPGPIHLEIPLDVQTASYLPRRTSTHRRNSKPNKLPEPTKHSLEQLRKAADLLQSSSMPLLLLGGGSITAAGDFVKIATLLGAPVLNTVNAKGIISPEHALFVGGSPSLPSIRQALLQADCVLAVGTEFGETDYDLLMDGPLELCRTLIRIDIDPEQLARNQQPTLAICQDARTAGKNLLHHLQIRVTGENEKVAAALAGADRAAEMRTAVLNEPHYHEDFARFFLTLNESLANTTIVGDSTRPTYYATWMLETTQSRRYFHSVSGFGTLGYALPAAMGASVASNELTLCIIGDGGIQFTLTEIATAKDSQIPLCILIWVNNGYEEIANSLASRGIVTDTTEISAPDFVKLAEAYDCPSHTPTSHDQLKTALNACKKVQGPSIVLVQQSDFVHSNSGAWYA